MSEQEHALCGQAEPSENLGSAGYQGGLGHVI